MVSFVLLFFTGFLLIYNAEPLVDLTIIFGQLLNFFGMHLRGNMMQLLWIHQILLVGFFFLGGGGLFFSDIQSGVLLHISF